MARVWVHRHDLAAGDLPALCAKTGVHCQTRCRVRLSNRAAWATWLLPYSWYADVHAGRFTQRAVLGLLPLTAVARLRAMRCLAASTVARVVGLVLLTGAGLAAMATPRWYLAARLTAVALSAFAVAAVLNLSGYSASIGGRIGKDGRQVRLTGVHPRFAMAVRAHYRGRIKAQAQAQADVQVEADTALTDVDAPDEPSALLALGIVAKM